jgi:hypothetical protein
MKMVVSIFMVIFALIFGSCAQSVGNDDNNGIENMAKTTLKIKNESSAYLSNIKYQSTDFGNLYSGESSMNEFSVSTDLSGYIYFTKGKNSDTSIDCRTQELGVLEYKETQEFVFTDNTIVIDISDPENVQTLKNIELRKGTVKIIAGPYFTSQYSFINIRLINTETGTYYSSNGGYLYKMGDNVSIIVPVGNYQLIGTQNDLVNPGYSWSQSVKTSNSFSVFFGQTTSIILKTSGLYTSSGVTLNTEFTITGPQ